MGLAFFIQAEKARKEKEIRAKEAEINVEDREAGLKNKSKRQTRKKMTEVAKNDTTND